MDRNNTSDARLRRLAAERSAFQTIYRFLNREAAGSADEDAVSAAIKEEDHIIAQIAGTRATTLDGVVVKARVCREIAVPDLNGGGAAPRGERDFGDELGPDQWWPLLRSIFEDLECVPLDDQTAMRTVFTELLGRTRSTTGNAEASLA